MINVRTFSAGKKVCVRNQRGVSLVEFMVASTIGLVLIMGAASLMLSSIQGEELKQDLDRMQENFRYGSNVIQRVVRQGASFADPGADGGIKVSFAAGTGFHDCVGYSDAVANALFVESGNLVCKTTRNGSVERHTLAEGYCFLEMVYWPDETLTREKAGSAKVSLGVRLLEGSSQTGCRSVSFVITMRPKAVETGSGSVLK